MSTSLGLSVLIYKVQKPRQIDRQIDTRSFFVCLNTTERLTHGSFANLKQDHEYF